MRSRLNKRKRDSSPDTLQPSRRRTPSNLLVAQSPDRSKSSGDSSPDSPPPGKMTLSFLNDVPWSVKMDITLFEELKRARQQKDDYLGLSWKDEKMWQLIHSEVTEKAPLACDLDEFKDRVQNYKSCYKQYPDNLLCRENSRLGMLVTYAFEKTMDAGPVTVPRYQSRSRSTSYTGPVTVPRSQSQSRSRSTSYTGQSSIGVSTARGGGNSSQYHTVMSELQKMRGPNPTDITLDEYFWAVNYFTPERRLPIFFALNVQDRLPFIKQCAGK